MELKMDSKQEKIIKREDGSRVKIITEINIDSFRGKAAYSSYVLICGKGKRKWHSTYSHDDYAYRVLDMEERRKFAEKSYLKHVSEDEIQSAKNELWNSLKPS
jgi:hypothetical protein